MAADMKAVLEALKARFIDQEGLTAQQAGKPGAEAGVILVVM